MGINVKSKKLISLCLLSSMFFSQCKKDKSLEIAKLSTNLPDDLKNSLLEATTAPSGAYNIQNSLPSGYVKDGSKDYTSYIQKAINNYSEIVFPGFPLMIGDIGLNVGSNKRITFLDGSELRLKPTSSGSYNVIDIRNATNVTLIDPIVVGDRDKHLSTSGEFGMGIGIRGSSNITLTSPKVSNCWGDGIYIGINNQIDCKNIVITNGSVTNNRRDGLTVISVEGLRLDNLYAGFNSGSTPKCGINFEPNSNKDELKNIVLNNPITEGNLGYGIHMSFSNLYGGSNKYIDIVVNNHIDKQSWKAIKFSCYNTQRVGNEVISANVVYNNPSWKQYPTTPNNTIKIALVEKDQKISINNPAIQTATGVSLSQTQITTLLKSLLGATVNYSLTFGSVIPAPQPSAGTVVFAVNAGGSQFTASNGITYLSDRNYSGGSTYKTTSSISNTNDDPLYTSERYGNFSYNIPVSNGTYSVTIKLDEIVVIASDMRRMDVFLEGIQQLNNYDIYAVAGKNRAIDLVKTVKVTDGALNVQFKTDTYYAKVSALHVLKI